MELIRSDSYRNHQCKMLTWRGGREQQRTGVEKERAREERDVHACGELRWLTRGEVSGGDNAMKNLIGQIRVQEKEKKEDPRRDAERLIKKEAPKGRKKGLERRGDKRRGVGCWSAGAQCLLQERKFI